MSVVVLSGQDDEALAVKAVNQGVQDYLVKGDITAKHLERAIRYAVERQALLRTLEITRKQQLEFKNHFLSHVSHELRTPLTCIHQFVTLLADGLAGPILPGQTDHLTSRHRDSPRKPRKTKSRYKPSGSCVVCGGDLSITSTDSKALNSIRSAQLRKFGLASSGTVKAPLPS